LLGQSNVVAELLRWRAGCWSRGKKKNVQKLIDGLQKALG